MLLIGEEIESPWNGQALADIAPVFGGQYCLQNDEVADMHDHYGLATLIAAENLPDAASVYRYRPPTLAPCALVVGNEAKGLRRRTRKQADAVVEVPLLSATVNCLNVAAAAAAMLYYLGQPAPLRHETQTLASIQKRRPSVLLAGGCDPLELGSTLRSACAFGWERVFLADRGGVWYECDRIVKSQGRGAARRSRNPIRVIPWQPAALATYRRIILPATAGGGRGLTEVHLSGPETLVVLTDEQSGPWSPPADFTGEIIEAALPAMPRASYHYRQAATIVLAEMARQLGTPGRGRTLTPRRRYTRTLAAEDTGIVLSLEELAVF
jgi:hypothetical protein